MYPLFLAGLLLIGVFNAASGELSHDEGLKRVKAAGISETILI